MKKIIIGIVIVLILIIVALIFTQNYGDVVPVKDDTKSGLSIRSVQSGTNDTIDPIETNSNIVVNQPVFDIDCFVEKKQKDLKVIYTGMLEDVYELPDDVIQCLNANYNRIKQKIVNGDIYFNSVDQLVLYKGTYFTGRNVLKLNGMIKLR